VPTIRTNAGALVAVLALLVGAAACGDDEADDTAATTTVTTTDVAEPGPTVEQVVAAVQAELDAGFAAQPEPPPFVLGAVEVICEDEGPVRSGDVLACRGEPRTDPDFPLDAPGLVLVIVDDDGRTAYVAGTDVPGTTTELLEIHGEVPRGLGCDELLSPDVMAFPFDGVGRPPADAYFWTLAYWYLEGRPEHMDPDGNGIPCEDEHDPTVIADVLAGGPVG
jgi:hypothetical protein